MSSYYEYWNNYYSNKQISSVEMEECMSVMQELMNHGWVTKHCYIDGVEYDVLKIESSDIDGKNVDEKLIVMSNEQNIHWGNMISFDDGDIYVAITKPEWNGVYSSYIIRRCDDVSQFIVNDSSIAINCAVADQGVYDQTSFVNPSNVYEDAIYKSMIVAYNANTKQIKPFDDYTINGEYYKVVKIDKDTYKRYGDEFGLLQLVVVDTAFGEIKCNGKIIDGIILKARIKDKQLNSVGREILSNYGDVVNGDYIEFTYDRNRNGVDVTETYLAVNRNTDENGFDRTLIYLCSDEIKLLDSDGNIVTCPLHYDDNRSRLDKEVSNEFISISGTSFMIKIQLNDVVIQRIAKGITNRVLVKGRALRITGHDYPFGDGVITIGLEADQITPDDNEELGVANYYSQMEEINGTNPPAPSGGITGDSELYLGYANQYVLNMPNVCTWSVNNPNVMLTDLGENKCELICESTKELNKTVILTARIGSAVFEKSIKIVSI